MTKNKLEGFTDWLTNKKVMIFSMLTIALVFAIVLIVTQGIFMDFKKETFFSKPEDMSTWYTGTGDKDVLAARTAMLKDPQFVAAIKSGARFAIPALLFAIVGLVGVLATWSRVLKSKQFTAGSSIILTLSFGALLISVFSNMAPAYEAYLTKDLMKDSLSAMHGSLRAALDIFQVNIAFVVICTVPFVGFRVLEKFN